VVKGLARSALALSVVAGGPIFCAAQTAAGCTGVRCTLARSDVAAISEHKQEFAASVRRFAVALADPGADRRAVRADLESMGRALDRWDAAIRDVAAAIGQSPTADEQVAIGIVYLERHRLDDALRAFTSAVRTQPSRADIHVLMAVALRHLGKPTEAARALTAAAAMQTPDAAIWYEAASALAALGLPTEAGAARVRFRETAGTQPGALGTATPLLRVTGETPLFAPALYAPGFALLAQGAFTEAIDRLRQALAADSLSDDATDAADALARGRSALRQGDLPSALTLLESAVALRPDRAEVRRVLGIALVIDGQGGRGLDELKAAIQLDPRDERAWMALADLLATVGQFAEAEQVLKGSLAAIPGSGQAHFGLGRLHRALGKYVDAARALEAAATTRPAVGAGALHAMMEETYVAMAAFDRAIDANLARIAADPDDAQPHRRLGEAYLRQDRDDEALTEFTAALALDARDAATHGSVAQIHLRAGRYADAAEASRRALALDPSRQDIEYALGTALMRLGRSDEGLAHLERYRRLQADATASGRRQHELERLKRDASVAIATSDYAKAVELLRRAVDYETAAPTLLALGFALIQTGRPADALVELQKAARLEDDANVHRYLAEAYRAAGRNDESRAETQLYLQMVERAKRDRLRAMSGTR
jgi:tetratricopeptide (TPR) repeat protein